MGGAVSAGENNDDLIDNLVDADYIKSPHIEKVFRAVDRADYYLPEHRGNAYKDLAWKHGNLHLSAPCIYSEVMESLDLHPGQSFLNLGSGTGYLSTMAGLILGSYGVNHGVEIHADVAEYAKQKIEEFKQKCPNFDEFDFCEPVFTVGNCLLINSSCALYDRVYCGAACSPEHEIYIKNLIKIGGTLVMPFHDQLLQITRAGETRWESISVLPVSFATLIQPEKEQYANMIDLPEVHPLSLQEVCRCGIRKTLRNNINILHPNLSTKKRKAPRRPKRLRHHRQRVNIVPMSMGMMILGRFDDENDDDENDEPSFWYRRGQRSSDEDIEVASNGSTDEEQEQEENEKDENSDEECDLGKDNEENSNNEKEDGRNNDEVNVGKKVQITDEEMEVELNGKGEGKNCEKSKPQLIKKRKQNAASSSSSSSESGVESPELNPSSLESEYFLSPRSSRYPSNGQRISTSSDYHSDTDVKLTPDSASLERQEFFKTIQEQDEKMDYGVTENEKCDEDEKEEDQEDSMPRLNYRELMKEKVNSLPIPEALKKYIMYYRE